jgi:hypothetical protein
LLDVGLDNWGAKDANQSSGQLPEIIIGSIADHLINPLAQVLPSESNLIDPRGFEAHSMNLLLEPSSGSGLRTVGIVIALFVVLALLLSCLCWEGSTLDDEEVQSQSKEVQQEEFAALDSSEGSWAQVYRDARGEQRESLELLFRCNIISTDEFAFSSVSQEHIQECIWIATHMLRQKPLEEWVALWQQAQQTFEDSVTACFEARGALDSSQSISSEYGERNPPMVMPHLGLNVPLSSRSKLSPPIDEDEDDPYTTRSHYSPDGIQESPIPRRGNLQETGMRAPGSQDSQNTTESVQTRWSIESDLDRGLAEHGLK